MSLDPISDRGSTQLYRIAQIIQLPEFVKTASVTDGVESLPAESFADPGNRRFPIHTKAATWMSYAYHVTQDQSLDGVRKKAILENLDKAAAAWGIELEIDKLKAEYSATRNPADVQLQEKFALEIGTDKYLPITTRLDIEKSATELMNERGGLPWEARHTAAKAIMKAARDTCNIYDGRTLFDERISKLAGEGCTTKAVLGPLFDRLSLHEDCKEACAVYDALPDGIVDQAVAIKLAGLLDGRIGMFPEDELFAFDARVSGELNSKLVKTASNRVYAVSELVKAGAAFKALGTRACAKMLGQDGELSPSKVANEVPSLSKRSAELLDQALGVLGVHGIDPTPDNIVAIALDRPLPVKRAAVVKPELTGKALRDSLSAKAAGETLANKLAEGDPVKPAPADPNKPITPFMEQGNAASDDDDSED